MTHIEATMNVRIVRRRLSAQTCPGTANQLPDCDARSQSSISAQLLSFGLSPSMPILVSSSWASRRKSTRTADDHDHPAPAAGRHRLGSNFEQFTESFPWLHHFSFLNHVTHCSTDSRGRTQTCHGDHSILGTLPSSPCARTCSRTWAAQRRVLMRRSRLIVLKTKPWRRAHCRRCVERVHIARLASSHDAW